MCFPLAAVAPIITGIAAGGSAVAGAVGSANAAGAQEKSAQDALNFAREQYYQNRSDNQTIYNQQRQDSAPWLGAGQSSLGELMRQMGAGNFDTSVNPQNIANDPGYQFRMQQGQQALERSASARGMMNSGGALKSLSRYSQGVASDEYQNAWNRNQAENTGRYNRLAGIAGVGQTAAQQMGSYGSQYGQAMNAASSQYGNAAQNAYGGIGNAQSGGAMGQANAVSGGFGALGNASTMYGLYQALQNQNIPSQGQSTGYASSYGGGGGGFNLNYGGG